MAGHSQNRPRRHRHYFTWGPLLLPHTQHGEFTITQPGVQGLMVWQCSCGQVAPKCPPRHGNPLNPFRRRSPSIKGWIHPDDRPGVQSKREARKVLAAWLNA